MQIDRPAETRPIGKLEAHPDRDSNAGGHGSLWRFGRRAGTSECCAQYMKNEAARPLPVVISLNSISGA